MIVKFHRIIRGITQTSSASPSLTVFNGASGTATAGPPFGVARRHILISATFQCFPGQWYNLGQADETPYPGNVIVDLTSTGSTTTSLIGGPKLVPSPYGEVFWNNPYDIRSGEPFMRNMTAFGAAKSTRIPGYLNGDLRVTAYLDRVIATNVATLQFTLDFMSFQQSAF